MSVEFSVNGKAVQAKAETDTPLLWVIRDELGLTGTKFGCGAALCGACTVHIDGQPARSCQTPVSSVSGKKVGTVEGLSKDNTHPLHQARSASVWLLPVGPAHERSRFVGQKQEPQRCRD
jgi:isoquinoline 1-oxidoreductase alpha subunit